MSSNDGVILTSTLWNQSGTIRISINGVQTSLTGYTYNQYCPNLSASSSTRSVTGCSNTADSQLLYYWLEKGYKLTLTVSESDYFYSASASGTACYVSNNPKYGELSLSALNNLLSGDLTKKLQNGNFIAALNYYCGVKNHSTYGSSTSTTWYISSFTDGTNAAVFKAAGFDSYFFVVSPNKKNTTAGSKIFANDNFSEVGFSILRENLDYGEVIRVGIPGHAIYMDGYRYNAQTAQYEYHLNYGWGNSSATKWYTVSGLKNLEITYVMIDISPDIKVVVNTESGEYRGGSFLRGVERINHIQKTKSTTFTLDNKIAGKTISLTDQVNFTSQVDLRFLNFRANLQIAAANGIISSRKMEFDFNGGSVAVNKSISSSTVLKAGTLDVDMINSWLYTGSWTALTQIGNTIKSSGGFGIGNFSSSFLNSVSGYAFKGGTAADTLSLSRRSAVFGDVDLSSGKNTVTIENGSLLYGALLGSANSLTLNMLVNSKTHTGAMVVLNSLSDVNSLYSVTGGAINVNFTVDAYASSHTLIDGYSASVLDDFIVNVTANNKVFKLSNNTTAGGFTLSITNNKLILGYERQDLIQIYSGGTLISSGKTYSGSLQNSYKMYVYENGVVNQTGVSGADMYVYSGGIVNNSSVSSNGLIRINAGTANNTVINSGGRMEVRNGGKANTVTVNAGGRISFDATGKGVLVKENGGYADVTNTANVTFASSTITGLAVSSAMSVHNKTVANNTTVKDNGCVYIFSGGIAENTAVNTGGSLQIRGGGLHKGRLQIASGSTVSAASGSVIDFTVSNRNVSDNYLINNLGGISGAPTYTVTVAADQTWGKYKLAKGAGKLSGSISIGNGSVRYGNITVNGAIFKYKGIDYRLTQQQGNLELVVGDLTPASLTISGNAAAWTAQNVTLTATSNESGQFQFFNGTKWVSGAKQTVSANGTYKFRITDAGGNITEKQVVVNRIDKAAPNKPAGFNAAISQYNVSLDWADAVDNGVSGLKGYYIRYGSTQALTGNGTFVSNSKFNFSNLAVGTYYYQVMSVDKVGNSSAWSALQSFKILPGAPQNLQGNLNVLGWNTISGVKNYIVEYSKDKFSNVISLNTSRNRIDLYALPAGTYQWRVKAAGGAFAEGKNIVVSSKTSPRKYVSDADGNMDLFFAAGNGTWNVDFYAQHSGILHGWSGTKETVSVSGKNKLVDFYQGTKDANILVLTDDANGDALFVDDIYSALPGSVAKQQARIAEIDEIRAGAGNDVVDMTSQRFAYVGDGVKIYGGLGNDVIWANNGCNTLYGDAGSDRLVGGGDDDVIVGGIGNDTMHGGGGKDTFCFGENWGKDTVKQLEGGDVVLWFKSGSMSNWNASTLTYTSGNNSVKVSGVVDSDITLIFGDNGSSRYDVLASSGCFYDAASEKIFENRHHGMLA